MQIWYESETMKVKAVYSRQYQGTVWRDQGYQLYEAPGEIPRGVVPGTTLDFDAEGQPVVMEPPPPPEPDPNTVRMGELLAKLETSDLTVAELNELKRLERGL